MHGEFLRLLFLQAHRETTAHFTAIGMPAQQLRLVSLPPRGVLQRLEEQSWSGCGESGGFEGQSQYHRLQHRSSPSLPVTGIRTGKLMMSKSIKVYKSCFLACLAIYPSGLHTITFLFEAHSRTYTERDLAQCTKCMELDGKLPDGNNH